MSNNYNTTLQSNNSDLQTILNTINNLPEAGGSEPNLQDKTISPSTSAQTVKADSGYDGLDTVTVNAMPTATQATPNITINASGLITATATQTAGYVTAGTKSATKQLAFQPAKTITPSATSQIAVSSGYYTGGNVTVAGDANLVAGNIKSGTSIFGVTGTYVGSGGSSGDTSIEDGLITKILTNYINDRVSFIGSYAFAYCSSLTSINFPQVTTISDYAFDSCSSLTSISFPQVIEIGYAAFANCSSLTSISFPQATTIAGYAFSNCSNLTSVNFPQATIIGYLAFAKCSSLTSINFPRVRTILSYAFNNCSSLTSVSFPQAKGIGIGAFSNCSNLTSINFPQATLIGSYAFANCSNLTSVSFPQAIIIDNIAFANCGSLTSISFPQVEGIGYAAFSYCSNLTSINFPQATLIGSYAFNNCNSLSKIYLLKEGKPCALSDSNAFSNTGIWSNKGSIFVPTSLVASYKKATNWAFFSNRIFSAP